MEEKEPTNNNKFFILIFLFIAVSIFVTYNKYIIREDFKYFTTEDEIPNQFDAKTYSN